MSVTEQINTLITGASGDIGRAIALSLAGPGSCLGLHYNSDREGVEQTAAGVREKGASVVLLQADLSTASGRRALTHSLQGSLDSIDILINNAGSPSPFKPFSEYTESDILEVMGVNFLSAVSLCQHLFPSMCSKRRGRIVNISSIGVKFGGSDNTFFYSMSKSCLEVLTRYLARQGARHNVLVNAIRPGVVDTQLHSRSTPNKDMSERVSLIPLGRKGRPDEIAGLVKYLAGEKGGFVTGETLTVSGGE